MSKRLKYSDPIFTFDVISLILVHLDVKDLFRYKQVSKKWNQEISLDKWPSRYERLTSKTFQWFQYVLLSNLDKPWDMKLVSANPGVTVEFMENHPEIPWDMEGVSENPNVTVDYILEHPEMDWVVSYYSENPSVTQFHVLNDVIEIDFQAWMSNVNCSFEFFCDHPELDWDLECLCYIPNITVEEYMSVPDVDPDMITEIRELFIQDIIKYPDFVRIDALRSPMISLQDIRQYIKYLPTTRYACANPSIPIVDIMNDPIIEKDFHYISINPILTSKDIDNYPGPYNYDQLSKNPSITFKDILEHPGPWNFRYLSSKVV